MYDLYLAQESYTEALRAFNERSKLHRNEVQPRLVAGGIFNGNLIRIGDVEKALRPFVLEIARNSTDSSIESIQRAFSRLMASKEAFRDYVVKHFFDE